LWSEPLAQGEGRTYRWPEHWPEVRVWIRTPHGRTDQSRAGRRLWWLIFLPFAACGEGFPPAAYDPLKAAQLSETRRREFDVALANELATWNALSARCAFDPANPRAPFQCREKFFRSLASEGYEIADIVSQIYFPSRGIIEQNRAAYERLRALAQAGDRSALCFAPYVFGQMGQKENLPYTLESEAAFTKQGRALGLPLCAINEFYLYWNGDGGYPHDPGLAHQRLLEAAKAGLYFGQKHLMVDYAREGFDNVHTVQKALCWGRLAAQHSREARYDFYIDRLRAAARDPGDARKTPLRRPPELRQLADKWDSRITPDDRIATTIEDCIHLEEEK
jgi:hypothetical protein